MRVVDGKSGRERERERGRLSVFSFSVAVVSPSFSSSSLFFSVSDGKSSFFLDNKNYKNMVRRALSMFRERQVVQKIEKKLKGRKDNLSQTLSPSPSPSSTPTPPPPLLNSGDVVVDSDSGAPLPAKVQ